MKERRNWFSIEKIASVCTGFKFIALFERLEWPFSTGCGNRQQRTRHSEQVIGGNGHRRNLNANQFAATTKIIFVALLCTLCFKGSNCRGPPPI